MPLAAKPSFGFTGKTRHAQQAAADHAAKFVTRVSKTTRSTIKNLVVKGIKTGVSPRDLATQIRQVVGLTPAQAAAVRNYRQSLVKSGLSASRVEKLAETYYARKLRERAITIARTEYMAALNAGKLAAAEEAREKGLLLKPVKVWMVTSVGACDICKPMNGRTVKLGKAFKTAIGPVDAPPLHPRCRCTVAIEDRG